MSAPEPADAGAKEAPAWSCDGLRYTYPGAARPAVEEVTLRISPRTFTAVLGPNGSGKSTLLKLLVGTLVPQAGRAEFGGRSLQAWARPELARAVGVVPQGEEEVFPVSVRELVSMGRYPHLGPWRAEGPADHRAVEEAMRRCDVAEFGERLLSTLSGGERQRVRIARALAQEAATLALDEPTAALDIRHEMGIFELVRGLSASGATVLLITHNLNLAARYADRLIVMDEGRLVAHGPPAEVITHSLVEQVWGWPVEIVFHPGSGPDAGAPQVVPLSGSARARPAEAERRADAAEEAIHPGIG